MAKKNVAADTSRQTKAPPTEYASAMDKLRDEMAKDADNYVQVVGEYLTDYLLQHPEAEEAMLDKAKSIKGSLDAVRKEAQKVKQGNVAILDDKTVFGIVLGYFGLKSDPDVLKKAEDVLKKAEDVPASTEAKPDRSGDRSGDYQSPQSPPPAADPFDLDALLGGDVNGEYRGEDPQGPERLDVLRNGARDQRPVRGTPIP